MGRVAVNVIVINKSWIIALVAIIINLVISYVEAVCTILNDCGKLGEISYDTTIYNKANPQVLVFKENPIDFGNGLTFTGAKFAFSPVDANPGNPYLGVWRIPKGTTVYLTLVNQHSTRGVNLHTHGLHIKGTGMDDPTFDIEPGQQKNYTYKISKDHRK
jgi:hypothetical protein